MNNKPMTQEDLLKVCHLLARKYKSNQELEDLIQEGYVVGLESIAQGHPKEHTYTYIRKAMSAYYNVKLKPVTMPASGAVLSMVSALAKDTVPEELSATQRAILSALEGVTDDIKPNTLGEQLPDCEVEEDLRYVLDLSKLMLEGTERDIIQQTLLHNKSPTQIVEELNISRSTFNRHYKKAVEKIQAVA